MEFDQIEFCCIIDKTYSGINLQSRQRDAQIRPRFGKPVCAPVRLSSLPSTLVRSSVSLLRVRARATPITPVMVRVVACRTQLDSIVGYSNQPIEIWDDANDALHETGPATGVDMISCFDQTCCHGRVGYELCKWSLSLRNSQPRVGTLTSQQSKGPTRVDDRTLAVANWELSWEPAGANCDSGGVSCRFCLVWPDAS